MISKKALLVGFVGLVFAVSGTATVLQSFGTISGTADVVPPIQLSEINADAADEGGDEYIEVYNAASEPVNLSKWGVNVSGSMDGIYHTSGDGTVPAGEYAVIIENDTYSSQDENILRVSGLSLANGGDEVSVVHPEGSTIDSFNYTGLECSKSESIQSSGSYLERSWNCEPQTFGGAN